MGKNISAKKIMVFVFVVCASAIAKADYFACEISQFGSVLASVEAEYRVLNAKVEHEGFLCEGKIVERSTYVKLTNTSSGEVSEGLQNGSRAYTSMSTLPRHNEFDIICTCGMQ